MSSAAEDFWRQLHSFVVEITSLNEDIMKLKVKNKTKTQNELYAFGTVYSPTDSFLKRKNILLQNQLHIGLPWNPSRDTLLHLGDFDVIYRWYWERQMCGTIKYDKNNSKYATKYGKFTIHWDIHYERWNKLLHQNIVYISNLSTPWNTMEAN